MIMYVTLLLVSLASLGHTAILECNFETACNDFILDGNWGVTDGLHPLSIDHDHTLNTSSGHYLFFNSQRYPQSKVAEIKTNDWLNLTTDHAICFQMWYYTPHLDFPFNIQLVQGVDERLIRIVASIPDKDPSTNDWTQIKIKLPAEKIKLYIRLNATNGSLDFDDMSIDYCDEPRPIPSKTLFSCDFESSCIDKFVSLSEYSYQWSVIQANDADKKGVGAPSIDYTFGNRSGHYMWLDNYMSIRVGRVGYLALQTPMNISTNESFCLDFQYYDYGQRVTSNLKVYVRMSDSPDEVQEIWPKDITEKYSYTMYKWTWGRINLPVGNYLLLFRMDSYDYIQSTFALDNIVITSCDYPPSQLSDENSLLSFSCNFDNLTMCNMTNGGLFFAPKYNFTVMTGDNIPNRELGPTHDHTSNSSSGGFIYWNQQLPYIPVDDGNVVPSKLIEQNLGMCIRFAYYVKSLGRNKNGTSIVLNSVGRIGAVLWEKKLDDSKGWQLVTAPVKEYAVLEEFYFIVVQFEPITVAAAFDDIEIKQCTSFDPTTTTTTSTSTTSTTTITKLTTMTSTSSSSNSTIQPTITSTLTTTTTTTEIISTITTETSSLTTSTRSTACRLISKTKFGLMVICLFCLTFFNSK